MAGRVLFDASQHAHSNDPTSPSYYQKRRSPDEIYATNKQFLKQEQPTYQTELAPAEEAKFQQWVKENNVPYDPSPTADYDMKGFYKGLESGDPHARTGVNANDNKLHFSDYWKTPYHESFSAESQFANEGAPSWNENDQLVTPSGRVLFDEIALNESRKQQQPSNPMQQGIVAEQPEQAQGPAQSMQKGIPLPGGPQ